MAFPKNLASEAAAALMPLGDHLEELRRRLVWALAGLLPILLISLAFGSQLLAFLIEPVENVLKAQGFPASLVSIGPAEAFTTYMKVGFICTIVVGLPWVLYQLWLFVAPGLYPSERRYVYVLLPLSSVLMLSSLVFLYVIVLPLVLAFFVNFGVGLGVRQNDVKPAPEGLVFPSIPVLAADPPEPKVGDIWINSARKTIRICVGVADGKPDIFSANLTKDAGIRPEFRVADYIGLLQSLTIAFAAGFQTPVVVLLLGWAGLITPDLLVKYRKHAILGTAVVSAFLTPGDITTMLILWIPLHLLYELGGVLLRMLPARRLNALGDAGKSEGEGQSNPEDDNPL